MSTPDPKIAEAFKQGYRAYLAGGRCPKGYINTLEHHAYRLGWYCADGWYPGSLSLNDPPEYSLKALGVRDAVITQWVNEALGSTATDRSTNKPELASATKHDAGKLPLEFLPPGPLFEIAAVLDVGRERYGAWNWTKGMAAGRLFGAMLGHVWAWWTGQENDPETGRSHLAHAGCCLLFLMSLSRTKPAGWVDDRPVGLVAPLEDRSA